MSLFLLALAGIPGTAGFMARFYLFVAAVNADQIVLVLLAALTSAISLFYYLRLPIAMYMRPAAQARAPEPSSSELLVLAICIAAVLYFGFFTQQAPWGSEVGAMELAVRAVETLR
jgi:NADH-quinone oxidoreductase subunit N